MSDTAQSSRRPLLIELGGDIDLANAAALGDALCEALDRTRSEMVVDLSAVPFIDSRGIAMMRESTSTPPGCSARSHGGDSNVARAGRRHHRARRRPRHRAVARARHVV